MVRRVGPSSRCDGGPSLARESCGMRSVQSRARCGLHRPTDNLRELVPPCLNNPAWRTLKPLRSTARGSPLPADYPGKRHESSQEPWKGSAEHCRQEDGEIDGRHACNELKALRNHFQGSLELWDANPG